MSHPEDVIWFHAADEYVVRENEDPIELDTRLILEPHTVLPVESDEWYKYWEAQQ